MRNNMKSNRAESTTFMDPASVQHQKEEPLDLETALQELVMLLEDYSPAWYTEEQRARALSALVYTRDLAS